jgi:hypothetical protein
VVVFANATCQVCCTDRPVKYRSIRVQICQWCVSMLSKDPVDPAQIQAQFDRRIDDHLDQTCRVPDVFTFQVKARLQLGVPAQDGFFESLFRPGIIEARKQQVAAAAAVLQAAEQAARQAERPHRRADLVARALGREDAPQTYSFGWRNRISTHHLIPNELVKRMNALRLQLLAGLERESRLDDAAWEALRQDVLAQDRYRCRLCDEYPNEKHVHHIIPLSKHGSNHPNNLITLCYRCHDRAHPDFHVQQFRPPPRRRRSR